MSHDVNFASQFADLQVHQRPMPQGASPEEEPAQGHVDSPLPQVRTVEIG